MAGGRERTFLADVKQALPPGAVDLSPTQRAAFSSDALGGRGAPAPADPPVAIVRPETSGQVAEVVRAAAAAGVALVPFGGGTGLMGGARSVRPCIVLDTSGLSSVQIEKEDRLVWAGAGAVLEDVDRRLGASGLQLGHDPWTYPVATVGGAISTNGLGYTGARYGGIAEQVLALEAVLADGLLVRTRAVSRRSTGPDLLHVLIGAEGTLGVITAAALKAFAVPESRCLFAFRFPTFEHGLDAVSSMAALGMRPCLLDYGEEHESPWPELLRRKAEAPTLYLGFEGFREEVAAASGRAISLVQEKDGERLADRDAEEFWRTRHVNKERFGPGKRNGRRNETKVAVDFLHVSLPPSQAGKFHQLCHARTEDTETALLECGLWLGPELFSALLALPESLGGARVLSETIERLLEDALALGGSMEYVHGVGTRLAHLMPEEHGEALPVLRRLKAALDPDGIFNPGKLGL